MKSRQMFQISQNNMHCAFFVVPCNLFQSDVNTVDQIHHVYNQLDEVQAEKEDVFDSMCQEALSTSKNYSMDMPRLDVSLNKNKFSGNRTSPICDLENCFCLPRCIQHQTMVWTRWMKTPCMRSFSSCCPMLRC